MKWWAVPGGTCPDGEKWYTIGFAEPADNRAGGAGELASRRGRVDGEELRVTAHHFVGEGGYSERLRVAAGDAEGLLAQVSAEVDAAGLQVMAEQAVPFPGGGATLVWVLAESHLVLHLWPEEDHATLDLHICDYRAENEARARRLRDALDQFCFAPGSSAWTELAVGSRRLVSA